MVRCDFTQGSKVMAYLLMRLDLSGSQLGKVELVPTYLLLPFVLLLLLHAEECCPSECPPIYTVPEYGDTRLESGTQRVPSGYQRKPMHSWREVTPEADSSGSA